MSLFVGSALTAYVITMLCSIVVARRGGNWRIRLLAYTVGLLPLSQAVVLLANNHIWLTEPAVRVGQSLELLVSALCLTAIHLLNRENRDRKGTDVRLRVAEAGTAGGKREARP